MKPIGEEVFADLEERSCDRCAAWVQWDADTLRWWVPYGYGNPPPNTYTCPDGDIHHVAAPVSLKVMKKYRLEYWSKADDGWREYAVKDEEEAAVELIGETRKRHAGIELRLLIDTIVHGRRTEERRF